MDDARLFIRAAAKHAAAIATERFGAEEDEQALADQFEAAGLDNLAKQGTELRADLSSLVESPDVPS